MKRLITVFILALLGAICFSAAAAKPKHQSQTVTYIVNMHCQNCVNKLTDNLSFIKGVEDFRISLKDKTVTIKFDPAKVQEEKFVDTIVKLGYTAVRQPSAAPADTRD